MKKIYTTILTVLTAGSMITATAQQQPNNGGFEDWDSEPEPVNWNNMTTGDLCFLCGFGASQRVFEDNVELRTGNASARIMSTNAAGTLVNGTMTTGQIVAPSTTPSQGYSITLRGDADFNHPFTDEPDSLVFWAKYNITDNSDSAAISAIIHEDADFREPGGVTSQIVASANKRFQTGGTTDWARISVPFVPGASTNPAAYILITFTSSYTPGQGNTSATLWVDDFEFIYNSPVTSVEEQLADVVNVYPNPTNDGLMTVSLGNEMKNGMVTVLNVMGQTVGQFSFVNDNRIDVEVDQPAGIYFLNIRTEEGQNTTVRVVKN